VNRLTFTRPPKALRRARADNLVLVPASLLPFKAVYQRIANNLPTGATLIVTPKAPGKPGQTLGSVARQLAVKGHHVKVVPATRFAL
jgi:hypothetical protein